MRSLVMLPPVPQRLGGCPSAHSWVTLLPPPPQQQLPQQQPPPSPRPQQAQQAVGCCLPVHLLLRQQGWAAHAAPPPFEFKPCRAAMRLTESTSLRMQCLWAHTSAIQPPCYLATKHQTQLLHHQQQRWCFKGGFPQVLRQEKQSQHDRRSPLKEL